MNPLDLLLQQIHYKLRSCFLTLRESSRSRIVHRIISYDSPASMPIKVDQILIEFPLLSFSVSFFLFLLFVFVNYSFSFLRARGK